MNTRHHKSLENFLRTSASDYKRRTSVSKETELKANFNSDQPRVPRGDPRGGEWTSAGKHVSQGGAKEIGRIWRGWERDVDWERIEWEGRRRSRAVEQFIARNRSGITRLLGALQVLGGGGEMVVGAAGVAGGVATSEAGVGIAIASASAWMVTNGYDNFTTGWRVLTTGNPQNTNQHTALRGEAFDATRTGFERTPLTFRVFDQFNREFGIAISNKTLDLARPGYSRVDRNAVYNTLAGHVDRVAAFREARVGDYRILEHEIRERRLHVLFPSGESLPGQAIQIAAAEQYAVQRGVVLQVEYAR